jgi:hypothetical protein
VTADTVFRPIIGNLVRAGVPQNVPMKMMGHKTDSVFRRYDIVSPDDLTCPGKPLQRKRD